MQFLESEDLLTQSNRDKANQSGDIQYRKDFAAKRDCITFDTGPTNSVTGYSYYYQGGIIKMVKLWIKDVGTRNRTGSGWSLSTNCVTPSSNTAPEFDDADDTVAITVNENQEDEDILSSLAVTDNDASQTLTWTQNTAPSKGAFAVSGTAGTGGSNRTPESATYTPTADNIGSDSFTVDVSDGTDTDTLTVNVTITDVDPDLTDGQSFNIDENSANDTSVGTVAKTGDTNGLIFSITGGNTNDAFKINASTGEIQVNDSNELDYETTTSYTLTIAVDDEDVDTTSDDTTTVTININNIDETAPTISSVTVPSNGTYTPTDNLDFTLNTDENVTVDTSGGTPYIL